MTKVGMAQKPMTHTHTYIYIVIYIYMYVYIYWTWLNYHVFAAFFFNIYKSQLSLKCIHHHEDVVNALQESSAQHLRHAPEAFWDDFMLYQGGKSTSNMYNMDQVVVIFQMMLLQNRDLNDPPNSSNCRTASHVVSGCWLLIVWVRVKIWKPKTKWTMDSNY